MTKLLRSLCACSLLILSAGSACGMFMSPSPVPLERLLKFAEKEAANRPTDPAAQYTLARVHYLAFFIGKDSVPAFTKDNSVEPPPRWMDSWQAERKQENDKALSAENRLAHAALARKGFAEALRLDPKHALSALGVASLYEQVRADASLPAEKRPPELREISVNDVWSAYVKALELGLAMDAKLKAQPVTGISALVSHEAATAILRLANHRDLSDEDKKQVTLARESIAKLERLPQGPITPIVFSLTDSQRRLEDLLSPDVAVEFDLRGYGVKERWSWVKPELGILVWDPEETGKIESARQLFGSYTFQIFWKDGYEPLRVLDDNSDGALTDRELDGLSAWFDQNSNGHSDPGEVMSLRKLNVTTIAAHATGADGIHPMNPKGIAFRDGRILRTWDWIAEPIPRIETAKTLAVRLGD